MATAIVVHAHEPGSPWVSYAAQDDAVQRFAEFAALHEKLHLQGEESFRRIEPFRDRLEIVIPMSYAPALVAGRR